jgi:hypothetical protein
VSQGRRKKKAIDDVSPHIIEGGTLLPAQRKARAGLILKIYEVDPITCPQCCAAMRILSFIEQSAVIQIIDIQTTSAYTLHQ